MSLASRAGPSANLTEEERARRIRSFVRREGRFTPAQQRAFEQHWSRYGLGVGDGAPEWRRVFGRTAPLLLEIGFGNGDQLLWSARNTPQSDFIGIEVHRPGVGRLMNALAADNVENVRLYNCDAVEVLDRAIGACALSEVRIYFPDPWPKKRQQKRRLIQPDFVALLASRVALGGRLHLATDWAEYAEQMLSVLDASAQWRNIGGTGKFSPRPATRIETHFEKRGVRLGHGVWDLLHERI
ncbi:MAG: tRNA (guanosine(46)-N7)-methyltransferase TrmB [Rudaea sp.]|nr:tRNA (guanosine(46)-N7)-methyltransferase TrmB [Rudaea sp.]